MEDILEIKCKKCNGVNCVKAGKMNSKQRYKCKDCICYFILSDERVKYSNNQRLLALQLYKKGLSLRSIAEIIGTNNVTILYWIRNIGRFVKEVVLSESMESCDDLDVIEIDEIWHYIKKTTKIMDLACLLSFPRKNYCL